MKNILSKIGFILAGILLGPVAALATVFIVPQGGTGSSTFTAGQVIYGNGTSALASTATTSVSCSGSVTCTSFTALGSSPVTINAIAAAFPFSVTSYGVATSTIVGFTNGMMSISTTTLSGTVTLPSFTLGSVLFAGTGGLLSQDNSNFFYDSTNHRLGIGTTSPSRALSVQGNSIFSGDIQAANITATGTVAIGGALKDSTNSAGISTQVLQSTGTGIAWATPTTGSAITVYATTTNATVNTRYSVLTGITLVSGDKLIINADASVDDCTINYGLILKSNINASTTLDAQSCPTNGGTPNSEGSIPWVGWYTATTTETVSVYLAEIGTGGGVLTQMPYFVPTTNATFSGTVPRLNIVVQKIH